jgi:hypothetical protein
MLVNGGHRSLEGMSRISRIAVAVECAVILAPLTLLAMYGAFVGVLVGALASDLWILAVQPIVALVALGCGWHIALTFVKLGHESLVALPGILWAAPIAVAAGSLFALWAYLTESSVMGMRPARLEMFWLGSPALIPLAHLATERWMRAKTAPELEGGA